MPIKLFEPLDSGAPLPDTGLGGKIAGWGDRVSKSWQYRLHKFLGNVLAWGLDIILDAIGKGMGERLDFIIDEIGTKEGMPAEERARIKRIWAGHGEWQAVLASTAAGGAVGGLISSTLGPYLKLLEYKVLRDVKSARLDPSAALAVLIGFPELPGNAKNDLLDMGYNEDRINQMKELTKQRLNALQLCELRRRFDINVGDFYTRMQELGIDANTANEIFALSAWFPNPDVLVSWIAREVYEPGIISQFGLDADFGTVDLTLLAKGGVSAEQARNLWIAHWEHIPWTELVTAMRRGLVTEADIDSWFGLIEMAPYWRNALKEMAWATPTRVDVRRFWDMGTIDEARLREYYTRLGYKDRNLDDYVLWTKVYGALPDLLARYKNGWITLEDVYGALISYGMSPAKAQETIETKVKSSAAERTVAERNLTRTDIIKGVKLGTITRSQASELLVGMGYDQQEAEFILAVNVPEGTSAAEKEAKELSKSDVAAAFAQQLITSDEAVALLVSLRFTPTDAQFLVRVYEAVLNKALTPKQKELTKADINKGVTNGLLTNEEAFSMLLDIGYSEADASYILYVYAPVETRSPVSFQEFKAVVENYKQIKGEASKRPSTAIIAAERRVISLKARIDTLRTQGMPEDDIAPIRGELGIAEAEYRKALQA